MKKIEPAAMTLNFTSESVSGGSSEQFFIDLSQCASLINRRFYRQGLNWAVSNIKLTTSGDGSVYIQKLPESWVMSNSWEKGFRNWQRMNNEALSESESVRPRFLDFKVFANARHHNKGFGANLLPINLSTDAAGAVTVNTAAEGEWVPSKFVIPLGNADPGDTEEFEVIATGASFPGNSAVGENLNAVSLIEGYANSRGLPNVLDPNAPDDASDSQGVDPENWLQALFNEGTDQSEIVLADMITENNIAPYPFENDGVNTDTMYPGGETQLPGMAIHDLSFVTPTSIGGMTHIKGGMFPCGLIGVTWAPNGASNLAIQVELVPGPHRGYLCEPMTEM